MPPPPRLSAVEGGGFGAPRGGGGRRWKEERDGGLGRRPLCVWDSAWLGLFFLCRRTSYGEGIGEIVCSRVRRVVDDVGPRRLRKPLDCGEAQPAAGKRSGDGSIPCIV